MLLYGEMLVTTGETNRLHLQLSVCGSYPRILNAALQAHLPPPPWFCTEAVHLSLASNGLLKTNVGELSSCFKELKIKMSLLLNESLSRQTQSGVWVSDEITS